MKKEEKILKFNEQLQNEKDIIVILEALPTSLLERYNYNFDKIRNKIIKINTQNTNDRIYQIHDEGYLNSDGYEKNYIYVFKGSRIILYSKENDEHVISLIEENGNSQHLYTISHGAIADITADENMLIDSYQMILKSND